MLAVADALRTVLAETPSVPVESVPLARALGRVLAEDVPAVMDLPRWDNSAMDGYALRAEDTAEGEVVLRLTEVIAAGSMPTSPVPRGFAAAIMTGAPLPAGANAVVMVENTDGSHESEVRVRGVAQPGQHIRRRGEDVTRGLPLLSAGIELQPSHLGLLASQGVTQVMVSRRPVVAVLTTGNEVVEPGAPLQPSQIYSSNAVLLAAMIEQAGGIAELAGNAADDAHSIATRLQWCTGEADIVVTTGGVSAGAFDPVRRAFDLLGVDIRFHKVAMQPGKPVLFGVAEMTGRRTPIIGLPGNPTSAAVAFQQFVRPLIRGTLGLKRRHLPVVRAVLAEAVSVRPGRAKFLRVRLDSTDSGLVARLAGGQSSGMVSTLARAHGFLAIPANSAGYAEGDRVRVQIFDRSFLDGRDLGLLG